MADGDSTQSGADGTQSGTGETTNTDANSTNSGETGTQSGTETRTDTTDLERKAAEAESLRERMRAADQRAAKFEQELKQLRDKDLPEADKLKRDYEESVKQVESLTTANKQLALQVAFLKDNTYTWHNPERALKLVDLSQVEIGEDGGVRGLKDALKALATSDPYLVKQEVKEETKTPPGTAPGNNGASGSKQPANSQALTSRFPVLRTRARS